MTVTLKDEIEQAEAHLAQLRQRAASATCAEVGHRWKHAGGRWVGGCENCNCSAAVYTCDVCGDSDYGDPDAEVQKAECAKFHQSDAAIAAEPAN